MTRPELASLLESYRSLEQRVAIVMSGICAPFCSVCPTPCCRVEICREAADSPFLQAVQNLRRSIRSPSEKNPATSPAPAAPSRPDAPPSATHLSARLIITRQPSDHHRYALECLGDLITHIGAKVWKNRHLVETVTDGDLLDASFEKFTQRLAQAEAAFLVLTSFFTAKSALTLSQIAILSLIRKPAF